MPKPIKLTALPVELPADAPDYARVMYKELVTIRVSHEETLAKVAGLIEDLGPLVDKVSNHPMIKMLGA